MNIHVNTTNMELTLAIREYVEKKVSRLQKFVSEETNVRVEIGKTTNHHHKGDVFRAEINIHTAQKEHRTESETVDLYKSIDSAVDQMEDELSSHSDKKRTLFKRGAHKIKNLLKGFNK